MSTFKRFPRLEGCQWLIVPAKPLPVVQCCDCLRDTQTRGLPFGPGGTTAEGWVEDQDYVAMLIRERRGPVCPDCLKIASPDIATWYEAASVEAWNPKP